MKLAYVLDIKCFDISHSCSHRYLYSSLNLLWNCSLDGTSSSLNLSNCIHIVTRVCLFFVSERCFSSFRSISISFFFYICMVLSYFVIDTHLSNEAVTTLLPSFWLKLSNPMLIYVDKLFGVLSYNIFLCFPCCLPPWMWKCVLWMYLISWP